MSSRFVAAEKWEEIPCFHLRRGLYRRLIDREPRLVPMSCPIDRRSVDQLVVEHLPVALRLAQRLTNDPDTAEDVVQEALCRVLKRWKSYRGEATFSTWMMQIVVNVDRDRRRRWRKTDELPHEL